MYYFSTDTAGKGNIIGEYGNLSKHSDFVLPVNYQAQVPFELFLCTSLPDRKDSRLIIMQSSPKSSLYTNYTNEEVEAYINNGKLHQHDFYELMFVIEGTVYQNIEHERHVYPSGSCCLLNTSTQHIEEYHNESRILFLQFSKSFVKKPVFGRTVFFCRKLPPLHANKTFLSAHTASGKTRPKRLY